MTPALSATQRDALAQRLRERLQELDRRRAQHDDGLSRAEHARDMLLQDGDDATQRDADREVDLARSDRDIADIGAVSLALQRVQSDDYGPCVDCGADIPFERLLVEPQTLRCVACETLRETTAARGAHTATL